MAQKTKPTLKQISELSGYSVATVSMILNRREDVSFSPEAVERVRAAAYRLGYEKKIEPVRKRRYFDAKTIAVVCPNISNPYYSTLVQSIEQAAHGKGYRVITVNTYRSTEIETGFLETLRNTDISGILYTMNPQAVELLERINLTLPVVAVCDKNTSLNIDTVEMDNYSAGTLIARHLLELGHRHIVYVSTTLNSNNRIRLRRLEGVEDTYRTECPEGSVTVRSLDIEPSEELGDLHIEHRVGYELGRQCLSDPELTAFVAVNDMVAYGVMDAVLQMNRSIPEDYSVCAFDNIFPSRLLPVSLTSVDHYIAEKGHNAVEMLLDRINGAGGEPDSPKTITRIEYPPRLIVRASTARARDQ